ncbi:MAG: ketopantoate reductase family protein [Desulfosarcinaceae bacterium]|nr:ketopantoate reductase family protein [Desulfosarcinaceae bacterium]
MKIAIVGCGALGSTFGGILTEAGADVLMVNPKTDHIDAVLRNGLKITEEGVERTVRVNLITDCTDADPVDLIIVLVKSNFTRAAIEGARPLIGQQTLAISCQNGLGNEEVLAEYLGADRVLSGKTYVGGVMTAPGQILVGRKEKLTVVGEMDGQITERLQAIRNLFNGAGFQTEVSANIRSLIWSKLLINVSTGAVTGLTRLTYGNLLQVPEAVACCTAAVAEALEVARRAGVELTVDDPQEILDKAVEGLPFDFKTSMLQDIERGAMTEIDFINGAVVRLGDQYGVPTPVNRTLVAGIKGVEHRLQHP